MSNVINFTLLFNYLNLAVMKQIKKGLYQANCDMPIKYTFKLGGGINSRCIKKGEYVNAIDVVNDVNTQSVATIETLNRIELNYFLSNFTYIGDELTKVIESLVPGGQKISFTI